MGIVSAQAASGVAASLDRGIISVGESATLSLKFEGGAPDQPPAVPSAPNLSIVYVGQSSQFTIIQGRASSTLTHNYQVTPTQPGDYVIPALQIPVAGRNLTTQPVRLRVLKGSDSATAPDAQSKLAFVRLIVPKNTAYVGEVLPVEIQLYVTAGQDLQMPQLQSDGFVLGTIPKPTQSQVQMNNLIYNVVVFKLAATAIKTGRLTLGPAQISLVLRIRQTGRRARDPFDSFPDLFDFPDGRFQRQPVTLVSDPQTIEVLPLPDENKPADFNGAVGNFSMTVSAGPTNAVVGDPITLKVEITGRGALDSLTLPTPNDWRDFKTYQPAGKIESKDPLGMAGVKSFEQVVIPQNVEVKEIPSVTFSFFDPDRKSYRTLRQAPIPISIRASAAAQPQPTVLANTQAPPEAPPPRDIVPIKPRLGMIEGVRLPLVRQTWFNALQALPLLCWLGVVVWRKRQDALANDPRLRRRRQVAETVRKGLKALPGLAAENKTEEFFAGVFRLLQEQLGERLNLPASAITEAVLDERLPARSAPESLISDLHELFQLCNQARYAPQHTSQELISLLPKVESALHELQNLPDENGR